MIPVDQVFQYHPCCYEISGITSLQWQLVKIHDLKIMVYPALGNLLLVVGIVKPPKSRQSTLYILTWLILKGDESGQWETLYQQF